MTSPKNHYELHAVASEDWSGGRRTRRSLPKDADPREFLTTIGLTQPGASASVSSVSVYVILISGGERGSVPLAIIRPA